MSHHPRVLQVRLISRVDVHVRAANTHAADPQKYFAVCAARWFAVFAAQHARRFTNDAEHWHPLLGLSIAGRLIGCEETACLGNRSLSGYQPFVLQGLPQLWRNWRFKPSDVLLQLLDTARTDPARHDRRVGQRKLERRCSERNLE